MDNRLVLGPPCFALASQTFDEPHGAAPDWVHPHHHFTGIFRHDGLGLRFLHYLLHRAVQISAVVQVVDD